MIHRRMYYQLTIDTVKTTIIQCASGRFIDLQSQIAPHHAAYCRAHGYNYLLHYGRVQTRHDPTWDKVYLVRDALQHSNLVIWLDTDSLIVDPATPVHWAANEFDYVGACRHPEPWGDNDFHYNCGVMFFLPTRMTLGLLERVIRIGQVPHDRWKVQATILAANQSMGCIISRINDKWNSTVETNVSPTPVIESWHGHNQNFEPILDRLAQVSIA